MWLETHHILTRESFDSPKAEEGKVVKKVIKDAQDGHFLLKVVVVL